MRALWRYSSSTERSLIKLQKWAKLKERGDLHRKIYDVRISDNYLTYHILKHIGNKNCTNFGNRKWNYWVFYIRNLNSKHSWGYSALKKFTKAHKFLNPTTISKSLLFYRKNRSFFQNQFLGGSNRKSQIVVALQAIWSEFEHLMQAFYIGRMVK